MTGSYFVVIGEVHGVRSMASHMTCQQAAQQDDCGFEQVVAGEAGAAAAALFEEGVGVGVDNGHVEHQDQDHCSRLHPTLWPIAMLLPQDLLRRPAMLICICFWDRQACVA